MLLHRLLSYGECGLPAASTKRFIDNAGGLVGALTASPAAISRHFGPDSWACNLLPLVRSLMEEATRPHASMRPNVTNGSTLLQYLALKLGDNALESFFVFYLDDKGGLIAEERIALGGIRSVVIEPRAVIVRALEAGATHLILAHNHPSGNPEPSRADISLTRTIAGAGRSLDITVHDHLIVAGGATRSFRAMGLL